VIAALDAIAEKQAWVNRAFSAVPFFFSFTWGAAPGLYDKRAVGAEIKLLPKWSGPGAPSGLLTI